MVVSFLKKVKVECWLDIKDTINSDGTVVQSPVEVLTFYGQLIPQTIALEQVYQSSTMLKGYKVLWGENLPDKSIVLDVENIHYLMIDNVKYTVLDVFDSRFIDSSLKHISFTIVLNASR